MRIPLRLMLGLLFQIIQNWTDNCMEHNRFPEKPHWLAEHWNSYGDEQINSKLNGHNCTFVSGVSWKPSVWANWLASKLFTLIAKFTTNAPRLFAAVSLYHDHQLQVRVNSFSLTPKNAICLDSSHFCLPNTGWSGPQWGLCLGPPSWTGWWTSPSSAPPGCWADEPQLKTVQ